MKNYFSITIPKPCHEDWKSMTPKDKGRFCDSCAKTVIDFTKMSTFEVQDFIQKNKKNRICGHFKQTQLNSINIYIPSQVLVKQQSFHKLFLLVLLIVMGTSLMNCTNKNGQKQKIDSIEVIDSINQNVIDVLGGIKEHTVEQTNDTIACKTIPKKALAPLVEGELNIESVGEVEIIEPTGIITYEGNDLVVGYLTVETPPEFKNTPEDLSVKEKRDCFSKKINEIVSKNFNTKVCLELKGIQRIYTQFTIDKTGQVIDIKTRAPHPALEQEAERIIKLLPKFIPAKQNGQPTKIVYNLPIIFQVGE